MRKEYLKIRDDVDLKELERFGFRKDETLVRCPYYISCGVSIRINDRIIIINDILIGNKTLSKLYDLISAGLVEKVVEDE